MTPPCLPNIIAHEVVFRGVQVASEHISRLVDNGAHSYQLLTSGVDGAVERNGLHRR
jgi:hypothetical protein